MRHLLNTLYVTSENAYLSLDGENVVVSRERQEINRFPLHTLTSIICFSYAGASPALLGACSHRNIDVVFCSPKGRFLARTAGIANGNVLLRREQYRIADSDERSTEIARWMILAKVFNARWIVERMKRDHKLRIDEERFQKVSLLLKDLLPPIKGASSLDTLRGLEGSAASSYFALFDDMILRNKEVFFFKERSRRPPMDNVNALLSFTYSLLAHDCASALESTGLDPYVGFMHRDRPGRCSLALDLMEEFRPCIADRFVLTLINNQVMRSSDFIREESGSIRLTEDGRRKYLKSWQEKKQEMITHPFLEEKVPWGLVPYMQALLLARHIRGDLESYPPFLWK